MIRKQLKQKDLINKACTLYIYIYCGIDEKMDTGVLITNRTQVEGEELETETGEVI